MSMNPIYDQLMAEMLMTEDIPEIPSRTANQEDHSDPWVYAGEEADAPLNPE